MDFFGDDIDDYMVNDDLNANIRENDIEEIDNDQNQGDDNDGEANDGEANENGEKIKVEPKKRVVRQKQVFKTQFDLFTCIHINNIGFSL